jgi:tRNA A37 threonylcarbamoyladenosine dehydratase
MCNTLCNTNCNTECNTVNLPERQALFQRFALITGAEILEKLAQTSVLIFGVGGVGSWCAEALVRSGIGRIGIVDYDTVCASNVNRQVQATSCTLGCVKVDVLKKRLLEINPDCEVIAWEKLFSRECARDFGMEKVDYIIDAIDSLPHKLDLIETAYETGVTFFSSMGMAWKMDPTRITTGSIWETHDCHLARLVRQGLRKRGFSGSFTVVYSEEQIKRYDKNVVPDDYTDEVCTSEKPPEDKKLINGSAVTVTASAGMILASLVLRNIIPGA